MPALTLRPENRMPSIMQFRSTVSAASALAAILVLAGADRAPAQSQPLPPVTNAPAPAKQAPAGKPATKQGAQPAQTNEQALRQRVEQLEEQLVDLQVVIGTLESLAKTPAAQGAASPNPADAQRIQALEAQLKSLSSQIEQLGEKVRGAGEPTRRTEAPAPRSNVAAPAAAPQVEPSTESVGSSTVTSARPAPSGEPQYETAPGTVLPPIGEEQPAPAAAPPSGGPSQDMAAIEPPGDPKHDYEVAYSYVIQRDYGAAQAGFTDFMKRYPKDPLVPNALYWLGETHYQQRNFADAAEAFDLVTRLYASSPKAADSQLKRALSFSALGKNNEACSALADLDAKFENAPAYVKTRAGSERRRLGCTG